MANGPVVEDWKLLVSDPQLSATAWDLAELGFASYLTRMALMLPRAGDNYITEPHANEDAAGGRECPVLPSH